MKRILLGIGGMALSCTVASSVFAGAVDNKTNWSAEYIRTLNRNAATDYADIAAYNPAGTVKLNKGFILNGSVQYLSKVYENVVNGSSYESDEPSYIPGVFGVYNTGKWSLYGAFSNYGGGGKVDFPDGDATTISLAASLLGNPLCPPFSGTCTNFGAQQLSAESFYLGYTIGGAYSLNDMVSFSIGLRYIDAHREAQGSVMVWNADFTAPFTARVDYEQDDNGFSGIFGANISPTDKLNIGIRYEMKTSLDLKSTVYEGAAILAELDPPVVDGQSTSRDLPALLGLGASYQITPKLRTEVNFTYYFNEDADWSGAEESVNNGYDLGIAFEYLFTEKILGSIGYLHTELGVDPANFLPENPELDANTFGAGIAYAFTEKFHTNLSIGNSFYEEDSYVAPSGALIEYKKNVFFLALGLEYRFM